MSIFFATPMYGGFCQGAFFESAMALSEDLNANGLPFTWLTTLNESLVPRARNTSVATFLKTDYERMMFIDADIDFSPEDVAKLWNLDVDVAVAAYPMKNLGAPLSAWRKGKMVEITDETEPFPVDFAGTGFMMIKRHVFEKMIQRYPQTIHQEGHVGKCYALFDCEIHGGDPDTRVYLSEDYTFCHRWRYLEGEIICDPTIRLGHWGTYRFDADIEALRRVFQEIFPDGS